MKKRTNTKRIVLLSAEDRNILTTFTKKGTHKARCITRAKILLRSDRGETDVSIQHHEGCGRTMVKDVRARYCAGGIEVALFDRPRSGQPPKLDEHAEAYLIATACSEAPEGHDHWTLELLREKMITEKKVKSISTVALWKRLDKKGIKPWVEKNVVCS